MIWTLEKMGTWIDGEGKAIGWAVIDEDGEEIEFFREQEDAEEFLQEAARQFGKRVLEYT